MTDDVFIRTHDEIDRIAPGIYGHFAEHLGRCIYGGIWVGEDDRVDTDDGIRLDTVELLRDLEMPVLRWPGGCFADDYHWQDGVGPREERPTRRNLWWTQGRENIPEETNEFGTDEFLRLCDLVDTEPYLAINVGSGDPNEATNWIEYCNYDGGTEYAQMRRDNGHEEPYDVTYWGVGNENWGCGGRYEPSTYGEEYRRYANYLRGYDRIMGDGGLDLIACGHITPNWNREFMESVGGSATLGESSAYQLMDHLSVHRYYEAGGDTDFTDEQYFRLFARSLKVAEDVDRAADVIESYAPGTDIGVIVDEWGVWHPEAVNTNGLEQENTVRDALTAAGILDELNARADVVTMANIAQTVNVLQCLVQTDEETAWKTPTYQVFDLYKPHMGATALRTVVDTDVEEVDDEDFDVPLVSASASRTEDGDVYVTVSNRDFDGAREVRIDTDLAEEPSSVSAEALFEGVAVEKHSTSDNADDFESEAFDVDVEGTELVVDAPASSVVGVQISR